MPLEVLHGALVLFGGFPRGEGAEVASFASLRILFARVEAVFAGLQFPDHGLKRMQRPRPEEWRTAARRCLISAKS